VGCQDETHVVVLGVASGCDDTTPPDTSLTASPAPVDNLLQGTQITLTLGASYGSTGDTGAIGFQCDFYKYAAGDPKTWTTCASGITYAALSVGTTYVVKVRAVDLSDAAIVACSTLCALPYTETPDFDATPVSLTFVPTGGAGGGGGAAAAAAPAATPACRPSSARARGTR